MAVKFAGTATIRPQEAMTKGSVTSKDGTMIGYRQIGRGPALIILHGASESSQSHMQLAEALADTFTVYLPDRRGRGLSGPYGKDYSIRKDVEDMDALLTKTGARYVMGVSSGAIIWLKAMLSLPTIQKAIIFEPPLAVNGSISMDFMTRFDEEIAQGKIADALVTGMLGAQMGPPIFQKLPRWFLKFMTWLMIRGEKPATADNVGMGALAPTLHYDFQIVAEMSPKLESFKAIQTDILLLGGSDSPAYLKTSVRSLEKILPRAKRIELSGAGHGVTGNTNQMGQPDRVSQVVREFFA